MTTKVPEPMQCDQEGEQGEDGDAKGSPTEIAESEEDIKPPAMEVEVKQEKRKRERDVRRRCRGDPAAAAAACVPVDDSEEGESELDSPSKRALHGDDAPLSSRDIKELLFGHVKEMKEAWRTFQGRLDQCESVQVQQSHEMINIRTRTAAVEKTGAAIQRTQETTSKRVDDLAEEVKNMKVQLGEIKANGIGPASKGFAAAPPSDPWASYLQQRNPKDVTGGVPGGVTDGAEPASSSGRSGDVLSEEEKRTLVVGGWARDTKRSIIEQESAAFLATEGMKKLLDVDSLAIYGPRRSVGMLKFHLRDGEGPQELRTRMWEVIKLFSATKVELPSTKEFGAPKTMWASFVKTKNARLRSTLVSQVRRVACDLAMGTKNAEGGILNLLNTQFSAYDCDWNMGTVWCGQHKLASATHKAPRDSETVLLSGGWVDLRALAATAGCSPDENLPGEFDGRSEYAGLPKGRTLSAWRSVSSRCSRYRWGRVAQWNLAGQPLIPLDLVAADASILFVQEIAKGKVGWDGVDTTAFHWVTHRDRDQWRGVGIGFANEIFDSIIHKVHTKRGIWVLARLVGLGRVVCGSLHAPTGVTNLEYQAVDANEVPSWIVEDEKAGDDQARTATHFPRDETRSGRQIDMIFTRGLCPPPLTIEPDRRFSINTDHAILHCELFRQGKGSSRIWGNDSRARWVNTELPDATLVDDTDITELARTCTRPRRSQAYKDSAEIKDTVKEARRTNDMASWKRAHRLRRRARRDWEDKRLSRILVGSWDEFRQLQNEKKRRRGWWGNLLQDKASSTLTREVREHLEKKMVDPSRTNWDVELAQTIKDVTIEGEFLEFTILDIRVELQQMRCRSSIGPDGISVHLLREISSHDTLAPQFVALVNHIIRTGETPDIWRESFLALLAKCRQAADLIGSVCRARDVIREWRLPCLLCKLDVAGAFDKVDRRKVAQLLRTRMHGKNLSHELRYLLGELRTHRLQGAVPGGDLIALEPNNGIKQGAPESAEVFGLLIDSLLSELVECSQWRKLPRCAPDIDIDLLFYQDDIFVLESDLGRLIRRIRVINKCLGTAGLHLATSKTKIVASPDYGGPRRASVGEDMFEIAAPDDSLKVLGLDFSFTAGPSQQAQELLGRARGAAAKHQDILCASGPWAKKIDMIRCLVESQWSWTAGALYWSGENWVTWNSRTLRFCIRLDFMLPAQSDSLPTPMVRSGTFWHKTELHGRFSLWPSCPVNSFVNMLLLRVLALPYLVLGVVWETEMDDPENTSATGSSCLCSETPQTPMPTSSHPPWTHEQYIHFMAAAWDENVSASLQIETFAEEEVAFEHASSAPHPEMLPVPFLPGGVEQPAVDWALVFDNLRDAAPYLECFLNDTSDLIPADVYVVFFFGLVFIHIALEPTFYLTCYGKWAVMGAEEREDGPVVVAKSFYGETFEVWSSGLGAAHDNATTAGEDANTEVSTAEMNTTTDTANVDDDSGPASSTDAAGSSHEAEGCSDGSSSKDACGNTSLVRGGVDHMDILELGWECYIVELDWEFDMHILAWFLFLVSWFLVVYISVEFLFIMVWLDDELYHDDIPHEWFPAENHNNAAMGCCSTTWMRSPLPSICTCGTTTSTTTASPGGEVTDEDDEEEMSTPLPNAGLFPEVRPATVSLLTGRPLPEFEETMLMQLTGAERRRLEERGVPANMVQRVENLFQILDRMQEQDQGPEGRWALGCLRHRLIDGMEALEALYEVITRRLVPRGFLPIRRVPREEQQRWRLFNWIQNYVELFTTTLERHLSVRLQPADTEGTPSMPASSPEQVSLPSSEGARSSRGTEAASSSTSGRRSSSRRRASRRRDRRTRSRSPTGTSVHVPSMNSEWAANSQGELVWVPPRSPTHGPFGPPPPMPVNLPTDELQGIWREPVEASSSHSDTMHDEDPENSAGGIGAFPLDDAGIAPAEDISSTTSTSTTSWSSTSASSTMTTFSSWSWSASLNPMIFSGWGMFGMMESWDDLQNLSVLTSSSTTTTSSSSLGITWPSDVVRDVVNVNLIHGGSVDVVELVRRLLVHLRRGRHRQRLLEDAIEEALNWIQIPLPAVPLNAATYEQAIWSTILHQAEFGSGPTTTSMNTTVSAPSALLTPGFPMSVEAMLAMFPGTAPNTIVGYRRRAWRVHSRRLYVEQALAAPEGNWPSENNETLYLVQQDETMHLDLLLLVEYLEVRLWEEDVIAFDDLLLALLMLLKVFMNPVVDKLLIFLSHFVDLVLYIFVAGLYVVG
ncbi:unnamed protein product [Symbiodinium sp. CCMP2592]|nr:unnamed protein product [Symbiodinium sp. CCMP2592]